MKQSRFASKNFINNSFPIFFKKQFDINNFYLLSSTLFFDLFPLFCYIYLLVIENCESFDVTSMKYVLYLQQSFSTNQLCHQVNGIQINFPPIIQVYEPSWSKPGWHENDVIHSLISLFWSFSFSLSYFMTSYGIFHDNLGFDLFLLFGEKYFY